MGHIETQTDLITYVTVKSSYVMFLWILWSGLIWLISCWTEEVGCPITVSRERPVKPNLPRVACDRL